MQKTEALNISAALNNLRSKLINNYDLTEFEYYTLDVALAKYIEFVCKRNLAYKAAENNNIKDFMVRYNNFIAAIPGLANWAVKKNYKITMLAKKESFFKFVQENLLQINSDNVYYNNNIFSAKEIRINMLENYLFNSYKFDPDKFDPDSMSELNAMACLTNSLLLATSSNDKEKVKAISNIIASIVEKKIASPTKTAIEDMIKRDNNISKETKNNIIDNKVVIANASKKVLSL